MTHEVDLISPEAFTTFGDLLTYLRKRSEFTQDELGRVVGYSRAHIARLEGNQRLPDPTTIAARFIPNLDLATESAWAARLLQLAAQAHHAQAASAGRPIFLPEEAAETEVFSPSRHNLPAQPTAFVGREAELSKLAKMIADPGCRLITLTGPGGVGKTRLALQAAAEHRHAFAQGAWFTSLAPLHSPDALVSAIADALTFQFFAQGEPRQQLLGFLRERQLLLVLDNFEHLLSGAGLIAEILSRASKVKVLVTSRQGLNLHGEWICDVDGLTIPAEDDDMEMLESRSAVRLFVQSAQRAWSSFSLQAEERPAVIRICRLVSGLPLALELAAAWLPVLSCTEIEREIEACLSFLAASPRDVAERHHSMQAVFDQSWRLLSESERAIFRRLSVFRGGFTRQAAEAVAEAQLSDLAQLTAKSLLRRSPSGRYEVHELLRQYGYEQLAIAGEDCRTQDRHLIFLVELAEQAEVELNGSRQVAWFERINHELDNIWAALEWSLASQHSQLLPAAGQAVQMSLRMAGALHLYWAHNLPRQGAAWLARLFHQPGAAARTTARARALVALSELSSQQNEAAKAAEESLAIYRALGDQHGIASALHWLGRIRFYQGDAVTGYPLLLESLARYKSLGDKVGISWALDGLGNSVADQDAAQARAWLEESVALCRERGDIVNIAQRLTRLGRLAYQHGDYASARCWLEESLEIAQSIGRTSAVFYNLEALGVLALRQGEYEQARAYLEERLAVGGEHEYSSAWSVVHLGYVALRQGAQDEARSLFMEGQRRFLESDIKSGVVYALEGLAHLAVTGGEYERAVYLFAWADAMREITYNHRPPIEQNDVDGCFAIIRLHLDEGMMAKAQAQGQAATMQDAITCATDIKLQQRPASRWDAGRLDGLTSRGGIQNG